MDCSSYNEDVKEVVASKLTNVPLMDTYFITEIIGEYAEVSPLILAYKKIYDRYHPFEPYCNDDERELLNDLRTPFCIDTVLNQPGLAQNLQNEAMICNFLTEVLALPSMYRQKVRRALMHCIPFQLFHFSIELFLNRELPYNYVEEPNEIYLAYDVHPEMQIDDAFMVVNQAIRLRYLLWLCQGNLEVFEQHLRSHPNNYCCEEEWMMYFGISDSYLPLHANESVSDDNEPTEIETDEEHKVTIHKAQDDLLYDVDDQQLTIWDDNMVSQHSSPESMYVFASELGWTSTVNVDDVDTDDDDTLESFNHLNLK